MKKTFNEVPCDFLTIASDGSIVCVQKKELYTLSDMALPRKGCAPIGRSERNCCVQVPGRVFMLGLAIEAIRARDTSRNG